MKSPQSKATPRPRPQQSPRKPAAWRSQHQFVNLDEPFRLVSKAEVLDLVGLSYPTIWAMMRDGKFPRSREIGGKVAWLASELKYWISNRPISKLKGDPPPAAGGAS